MLRLRSNLSFSSFSWLSKSENLSFSFCEKVFKTRPFILPFILPFPLFKSTSEVIFLFFLLLIFLFFFLLLIFPKICSLSLWFLSELSKFKTPILYYNFPFLPCIWQNGMERIVKFSLPFPPGSFIIPLPSCFALLQLLLQLFLRASSLSLRSSSLSLFLSSRFSFHPCFNFFPQTTRRPSSQSIQI